ncbi:MAG: hypothetical protein WD049_06360 [Candidatus Paceibacterota bacterium]
MDTATPSADDGDLPQADCPAKQVTARNAYSMVYGVAVANNRLLIRTGQHLYCVGQ